MSVNLSDWLLEGIDSSSLELTNSDITIMSDTVYNDSPYVNHVNYYNYTVYSEYTEYYNYYNYYNYYDYYNYSNRIAITMHPVSQSVAVNETVIFSVSASNTIDSCQWYISDSATGVGTAILGATSPRYSFIASLAQDNKYYYCIVRRGGNTATSTRASLTVHSLTAYDIYVTIGGTQSILMTKANPAGTQIVSTSVADPLIATVTPEGYITGVSLGSTSCLVTGSNGVTATFTITVIEDELVALLTNTAIAIRGRLELGYSIYPNQMYNVLSSRSRTSKAYSSLEEFFTDISNYLREKFSTSDPIDPHEFYSKILSLP